MSKKQDLLAELAEARAHVAHLENQLSKQQPNSVALSSNENPYHSVFDSFLEGCQIIGYDWRYLYINDAAALQSQYTKAELLGSTLMERYPNIETTPLFAVLQRCMQERSVERIDNEVTYPDGGSAWFELLVQPVQEGICILSHQSTTHKKTQAVLHPSEEMFSSAFSFSPAGLSITRIADGKFIDVNQAFCEMLEFSREEVIGHTSAELKMWTPEEYQKLIQQQRETGGLHNFELTALSKSGRPIHVLFSSNEIRLYGDTCHIITMIDISERKLAEKALRQTEMRFQSLVEAVEDYAIYLLDTEGHVASWNTGAERLKGYRSEEIIGQHFSRFFTSEDQQGDKPHRLLDIVEAKGRIEDEGWRVRKDGSRFWADVVITALRNSDNSLYRFAKITRDLTQHKRAEENIRKLHRTLGVLSDINQAIVRIRHLPSLFKKACEIAVEKGAFRIAWIGLFDPETNSVKPVAHNGISDNDIEKLTIPSNAHPIIGALRTGERLICNDIQNDPMWLLWREDALRLSCSSAVVLPLTVAGEIHGSFNLYADEIDFFDSEEIRLMDEMAGDISLAMEIVEQDEQRAQAETAVKRYTQRMEILHQIDRGIINATSIQDVVETALKHIRQLIPCQRAHVGLIDWAKDEGIVFAGNYDGDTALIKGLRLPFRPDFLDGYEESHLKIIPDLRVVQETNPRFKPVVNEGMLSGMSVLLTDRDHPIGVLALFANIPDFFTSEHQEIIVEIGSQLAIAIRQMQLSEQIAQHTAILEQQVAERTADLTAAKERVEAILNNSPDAILLVDSGLTIRQANSSFNTLFGCEWDAYFGKSLLTLLQPDDAHSASEFLETASHQPNGKRIEVRAIRKDGTTFDVELSTGIIKGDGLVCIIRDITERKAQERQLRYHASLQESVSDAVIVIDMANKVQSWNKAAEGIYGWTAEEAVGQQSSQFLHYEVSPEQFERDMRHVQEYGWLRGEIKQFHKDGHPIHIWSSITLIKDEHGKPLSFIAVNHDITERKAQERQLRYHASIQESVSDAVIATDMDFRIQSWNHAAETIYGWSAGDVIGKSVAEILQTTYESEADRTRNLHDFLERGVWQGEVIQRHRNGNPINILASVNLFKDETGQPFGIVSVNRDITERKQAETALQKSAAEISDLYHNAPCGYHSIDRDGVIVQINDTELGWLGYEREELVGKKIKDIFTPATVEVFQKNFPILKEQGRVNDLEFDLVRKDGSIIHILLNATAIYDDDGQYLKSRASLFDMTELREAQQAIIESEERYRLLAENIADIIMTFSLDRVITYMSPSCERLLGYLQEEVEGKSHSEFIHPEDYPQVIDKTRQAVVSKDNFYTNQFRLRNKAGQYIWYEVRTRIVFDTHSGSVVQFISVLRDITERKLAEDILRESEDRFRRAIIDAPFPIMIHAEGGEVLHISNAWTEISGYTHNDIPTMIDWVEKAYRDNSQTVKAVIDKVYALTKAQHGGEFRLWTKSGEERIWDFISAPLALLPDGRRMVSTMAMDITERKAAEEALQIKVEEERQFQTHLKALHEIIIELTVIDELDAFYKRTVELGRERLGFERLAMFLYDEQDGIAVGTFGTDTQGHLVDERGVRFKPDPNGIMQRSFERAERFYFNEQTTLYNDEQPVGSGWNAAAVLWNGTQSLGWLVADNLLSRTPASKPLLDIIGLYALSVGTLLAQKQTQFALRESEALHRLLAENINDLIMRSTLTSECLYISPSVQTLLGYTPEELLGQQTFDLVHPDDKVTISDAYSSALERNEPIMPHQYRARHKEAHYIWLETVGKPILRQGTNEVLEIITSSRDITARKQSEEALRESEERFRQIAENIDQILFMRSVDDQKMLYMSPRYEQIWETSLEDIYSNPFSFMDTIHPDDLDLVRQQRLTKHYQEEGFSDYEYRLVLSQERIRWVRVRTFPIKNNTNTIVRRAGIIEDITARKKSEIALRESEAKFRSLLDAAPIATIISDQSGRINLVNMQAEMLFGYGRSELIGQMVEVLVPDYARNQHSHNRTTYIAAPRVRPMGLDMELFAKHKDGGNVPVEIQLSYIETRDGIMVMSFILDITERKHIAAELDQQRSFLRNVIDVSPSMIFVKDYDARFVLANPLVAKMYNTTVEGIIGKTDADFNPATQEVTNFLEADRHVITSGEPFFIEEPITNSTGKTHWLQTTKVPIVSADGKSKYVLGVSTDITERKEAEEALRESEEKYRSLVETMRGGLAVFDTEFRVTYINDRFCELLGYSREEAIGTRPTDFIDAALIPLVQSHLERRQNAESTSYEIPLRRKDGHKIHVLMSGSPLLDKQGKYQGSFVVATDISVQKQAEETLRQALAKEKELGDLKTRFVSMASHEFRTPLATILATTETLSAYRHKLTEEQIDQRFDKIKDQVSHLKDIMEDVLMLARMQARRVEFNPVKVYLDALARSVLDEFESRPDVKHRLEYTIGESDQEVMLDCKLMRQIISNLVSNAIKYSSEDTVVRINLQYADGEVILKITDEGIGIPEADLPHLFEPFHRAANVGTISGTGLGLVITREAVELHGGTIRVESQQGTGTTFIIRIPISARGQKNDENSGH